PVYLARAAAASRDIVAGAVAGTDDVAHVLDRAESGHVALGEHGGGFARVDERNFLWRCDNDRARQCDRLHNRQLDIARARRQVENEIIEFAPLDLTQELLGVTRHHWSA